MTDDGAIFAALRRQFEDHGDEQLWYPAEGDLLVGYVLSLSTESGLVRGNIEEYPVLRLRESDRDHVWVVRGQARSLRSQLMTLQPGDRVGVMYQGIGTNANGDEWHRYEVKVGSPELVGEQESLPGLSPEPPRGFPIFRRNSEAAAESVVACPTCHADPGRQCVSKAGGKVASHVARRRAARRYREQGGE